METFLQICVHNTILLMDATLVLIATHYEKLSTIIKENYEHINNSLREYTMQYYRNQYYKNINEFNNQIYQNILDFLVDKRNITIEINNILIYCFLGLVFLMIVSLILLYISRQKLYKKYQNLDNDNNKLREKIDKNNNEMKRWNEKREELIEECRILRHKLKRLSKIRNETSKIKKLEKAISMYRKLRMNKAGYFILSNMDGNMEEKMKELNCQQISDHRYLVPLNYFKDFDVKANKYITI